MKNTIARLSFIFCLAILGSGCSDMSVTKEPIVLSMWHVYGGQADSPMNRMVDRFNQSVGREKGIIINVTSISTANDIHFALVAAAKKHPGAGKVPDIFTTYPKTPRAIGPDLMMDWREHLSEEQVREFVPSFVTEGDIDGRLVLLPIAKSSNALFINATIFDQFSRETGVKYEDLATWEGMFRAAERYSAWSGGKAFFKYDDWILYSMLNTISLGGDFFTDDAVNFRDEVFRSVWRKLAESAVSGGVCPIPGYATTAMMTGETICGVESTASILYFKDTVMFPDNTTIPLRLAILPPPYFKDGKRITLQRGVGLGVMKSTKEKERAAVIFAEWLTEVDNNMQFAGESGYFPVKEAAYKDYLKQAGVQARADKYGRLHRAIQRIHAEYEFYVPPFFENYGEVEKKFSDAHIDIFREYRGKIIDRANPEALYESMFEKLEAAME